MYTSLETGAKEENYDVPVKISTMMESWSNQGGYPLLTVERNYEEKTFKITQKQFFNDATLSSERVWYIPFNFVAGDVPDFRDTEATHYLLNVKEMVVPNAPNKDDWLILNKQSTGYYRIMYDERNYELISQGLQEQSHKIHPRNRAQLLQDAYRFATSNRLKHEILFSLLSYLPAEDQYAPWSTANSIFYRHQSLFDW